MTLSANQPYFFPYLTYYQMIFESDCFVILDNLNFFKRGFINRNVLIDSINREIKFTINLQDLSSNKKINEIKVIKNSKDDFLKKLKIIYGKKNNNDIYDLVRDCFNSEYISEISSNSIKNVFNYLNIDKVIIKSSEKFDTLHHLPKGSKIFHVCQSMGCTNYLNLPGGKKLYDKDEFKNIDVNLKFIQNTTNEKYSILNLLFRQSKDEILELLKQYQLE